MDARTRWRRVDAEHWVHVWGMVLTTLLVIGAAWVLLGGWLDGAAPLVVVAGVLAALAGWLTSAWRRELPWAWWVWTTGSGLALLSALNALLAGGGLAVVALVGSAVLLALLLHPDSRARIGTAEPAVR